MTSVQELDWKHGDIWQIFWHR